MTLFVKAARYTTARKKASSANAQLLAKTRIVLRELKEVRWRLRVLRACSFLSPSHDSVIEEAGELVSHSGDDRQEQEREAAFNPRQLTLFVWELGAWELGVERS